MELTTDEEIRTWAHRAIVQYDSVYNEIYVERFAYSMGLWVWNQRDPSGKCVSILERLATPWHPTEIIFKKTHDCGNHNRK